MALRLAIGEFADSLYESQRVIPEKATQNGFNFEFQNLESCLGDLLQKRKPKSDTE